MQQAQEGTVQRRVYRRELPGAGYVAIDVSENDPDGGPDGQREIVRIRVFVERRAAEERRVGHEPPVLADIEGDNSAHTLGELYRMASDNVALARALLEWQTRRLKERGTD